MFNRTIPMMLATLLLAGAALAQNEKPLIPDLDKTRKERIGVIKGRFVTPEGFTVEEAAGNDLVGSVVNMTFDWKGRPALSKEGAGILLLEDKDGDGKYDTVKEFSKDINTAHGMCFVGPGDLLVNANGPQGPGLYHLVDNDGDDKVDTVTMIGPSEGGIGEHGPHTIMQGPDGWYYVMYGNHSKPKSALSPLSPLPKLKEDQLLPTYVDPRGHAVNITAPGGTINRFDLEKGNWNQIVGGFRNAFDMAMDYSGEIFTYDSDMEWDVGLPWYRSTRFVHCIPGADYGWRTGSRNNPFYYIDALPSIDEPGRGSPVGVAFYYHNVYPERFHGAIFGGDWSRGRIRVVFPHAKDSSFTGKSFDFVLGEPLNVTDMDTGPDGLLYFSVGGRGTTGGLYRVKYGDKRATPHAIANVAEAVVQPMPTSAWGKNELAEAKKKLGADWEPGLKAAVTDPKLDSESRVRALEALQVLGPKPDKAYLAGLLDYSDPEVRAQAAFLLGTFPLADVENTLGKALEDKNPLVARRACEALVRSGLTPDSPGGAALAPSLLKLTDHTDPFLQYAARLTLMRVSPKAWAEAAIGNGDIKAHPRAALQGALAGIYVQSSPEDSDAILKKLGGYVKESMSDETLLGYLRVLDLALIRDPRGKDARGELFADAGPLLLKKFPMKDPRLNRELQNTLAYMQTPGTIPALLKYLTKDKPQEEQIHTVYALRAIEKGWTADERKQLIAWFDRGREMGGAASMEGYINDLWESSLKLLTPEEREAADAHKEKLIAERTAKAAALMAKIEGDRPPAGRSDLAQMSFQELSEYLEYDVMTYERGNAARGEAVFMRAKCVNCHVFGKIGKGGGPDLSTVVKRFRRKDILESIMYPSKVISDQYQAFNIELKNKDTLSGMLAGETDTTLSLIDATGQRTDIPKKDIAEKRLSKVSIMPEGLLDTMSMSDLVNLMLFLEKGAE